MSTLAKKLAAKGITLEAPQIPSSSSFGKAKQEDNDEQTRTKKMPPKSILKTPPVKKTSIRAPSPSASSVASSASGGVDNLFAKLSLDDACTFQTAQGFLAYSHISGRWMDFDFVTEDKEGFVLLRVLLHSGIKKEDFESLNGWMSTPSWSSSSGQPSCGRC